MKRILFLLSLFSAIYWLIANSVNVYEYAFIGGLFELTSILMLIVLFIVPILSFFYWYKEKIQFEINILLCNVNLRCYFTFIDF